MKVVCIVSALAVFAGTTTITIAQAVDLADWGKAVDPDKDCKFSLAKNHLTIRVPGTAHDLSAELGIMNAPRVLQEIEGDFIIQVKLAGGVMLGESLVQGRSAYQGAGLVLMKDDRTYIRLERAALPGFLGNSIYANFELRVDGQLEKFGTTGDAKLEANKTTMLRLERHGNKILAAVSQEPDTWRYLPAKQVELPQKAKIGVTAVNSSNGAFDPEFSELKIFRATPARAEKE